MYRLPSYLQQVKVMNNLYGAACGLQFLLPAMPIISKRKSIARNFSEEAKRWQKIDMERLQNSTRFAGITVSHAIFLTSEAVQGARRGRSRRRRYSKKLTASGRSLSRLRVFENSAVDISRNERVNIRRQGDGAGICEECGGPLHLPRVPRTKKQQDVKKVPSQKIPDVTQTPTNPNENAPVVTSFSRPKLAPYRQDETFHGTD